MQQLGESRCRNGMRSTAVLPLLRSKGHARPRPHLDECSRVVDEARLAQHVEVLREGCATTLLVRVPARQMHNCTNNAADSMTVKEACLYMVGSFTLASTPWYGHRPEQATVQSTGVCQHCIHVHQTHQARKHMANTVKIQEPHSSSSTGQTTHLKAVMPGAAWNRSGHSHMRQSLPNWSQWPP